MAVAAIPSPETTWLYGSGMRCPALPTSAAQTAPTSPHHHFRSERLIIGSPMWSALSDPRDPHRLHVGAVLVDVCDHAGEVRPAAHGFVFPELHREMPPAATRRRLVEVVA